MLVTHEHADHLDIDLRLPRPARRLRLLTHLSVAEVEILLRHRRHPAVTPRRTAETPARHPGGMVIDTYQLDRLPEHCDCGTPVEVCVGCGGSRCTACEPDVTDDCTVVFAAA